MLIFDKNVGIYSEDTAKTRERIANDWRDAFFRDGAPTLCTESWSPAGQLIDAETALVAEKDADVLRIGTLMDPSKAEGIWQDMMMKWFGLRRRTEQPTTVSCVCRGLPGTVIPRGSLVATASDDRFFSGKRAVIGDSGTVTVDFAHVEDGPFTVTAGAISRIITIVPGWDTVTNPQAGKPGTATESDADLEARRKLLMSINARGSMPALYSALWDAMGRLPSNDTNAPAFIKIQDNDTSHPVPWRTSPYREEPDLVIPPHSVCIIMLGGEDEKIAEAIYNKKSLGSGTYGNHRIRYTDPEFGLTYNYEIVRPEPVEIDVEVLVDTLTGQPGGLGLLIEMATGAIEGEWDFDWEEIESGIFFCPVQKTGIQSLLDIKIKSPRDLDEWVDIIRIPGLYYPVIGKVTVRAKN